jgi:ABC-type antimicrobial peptide transport system, ATPase component
LTIGDGEYVALTGPSGAGESTLINIIDCLDNPTDGQYLLDDKDICSLTNKQLSKIRNRTIGIVTQVPVLIDSLTAVENVQVPLLISGMSVKESIRLAAQALCDVGMGVYAKTTVGVLSGGERQRVVIARAVVGNPKILLADEPTGALDSKNAETVLRLLENINAEGKTVILVTHNEDIARRCSRRIDLLDGKVTYDSAAERK